MKVLIFLIIFFLLGALFLISENNLALRDENARKELGSLYLKWIGQLFDNSKSMVGYVVKLDWLPKES